MHHYLFFVRIYHLSIRLSSIYLFIHLPMYPSISLSIYHTHPSIYLSFSITFLDRIILLHVFLYGKFVWKK